MHMYIYVYPAAADTDWYPWRAQRSTWDTLRPLLRPWPSELLLLFGLNPPPYVACLEH